MKLFDEKGRQLDGDWERSEDLHLPGCPECGADFDQQCSAPDPDNKALGIELGKYIHKERWGLI